MRHRRSRRCGSDWRDSHHALMSSQLRHGDNFTSFRTFDELCDGFSNEGDALGVGIRPNGTNLGEQLLCTLNHVWGESIFRDLDQFRIFGQRCDL